MGTVRPEGAATILLHDTIEPSKCKIIPQKRRRYDSLEHIWQI